MTTRRSSAVLALLLSCLIAFPPAAFADDTELFTTTANPNVLLMLDTTGSMDTTAGVPSSGTSTGTNPIEFLPDGHSLEGRLHPPERRPERPARAIATWRCELRCADPGSATIPTPGSRSTAQTGTISPPPTG